MIDIELEEEILTKDVDKEGKKLYLHNDDKNTFDWVIKSLIEVCKHTPEQANQCSLIIHYKGLCAVKENLEEEKLQVMKKELQIRGLSATVE